METQELLLTALRAAAVYVLMLVVIRLMGKRTVGNFTAFDLLVALMLGEIVDEIIYGDVTFAQGTQPIRCARGNVKRAKKRVPIGLCLLTGVG